MVRKTSYLIILIFSFLSFYSNYKKFDISIDEINIFNSVASSSYEFDKEYIKRIDKKYPNLSNSAIPIKGVLGAYYVTNDSIDKGINLLNEANIDNPYIGYPDMILARVYEVLNQKDSFELYTNRAYNKLPSNSASYLLLSKKLINQGKLDSLSYFFNSISDRINDKNIWQIYLASMFSISTDFDKYKIDSLEVKLNAQKAKSTIDDKNVTLIADYLLYGRDKVVENLKKYQIAKDTFAVNPEYAIKTMSSVVNEIIDNYDYHETLIEMHFKSNDYVKVVEEFSNLQRKEMTNLRANIIEMIAISYLSLNDLQNGCPFVILLNDINYNLDVSLKLICQIQN